MAVLTAKGLEAVRNIAQPAAASTGVHLESAA